MKNVTIQELAAADNAAALALWEASVRASHDFVAEEDITLYRSMVEGALAGREIQFHGLYAASGELLAFSAVDETGEMLEMLFVSPDERGKGYGGLLLDRALSAGVRRVDVNEQNVLARRFYEKCGFCLIARSDVDGTGRPYPLLHLEFVL